MSILVGWGWAFGRAKVLRRINDAELREAIKRAITIRDDILADPNSTEEMRKNSVQAVNDLKVLQVKAVRDHFDRVKADLDGVGN